MDSRKDADFEDSRLKKEFEIQLGQEYYRTGHDTVINSSLSK